MDTSVIILRMIYKHNITLLHFMYLINTGNLPGVVPDDLCSNKFGDPCYENSFFKMHRG